MKDFKFENDFGGDDIGVLEERLGTQADVQEKPTAGADLVKQMEEAGMLKKIEVSSDKLEQLEPQTPAQDEKKGFLLRVKSFFGGKELSPVEKIDNQLAEDIKALTHITKSNAGMGGLGNFSSGGFKGASSIVERYGLSMDEFSQIATLQDSLDELVAGPEKVTTMKQLNGLKFSVMQQMRAVAERMKSNL